MKDCIRSILGENDPLLLGVVAAVLGEWHSDRVQEMDER